MVEDIVGCKWSLCVIDLVNRGVQRPGAMQRSIAGLTAKVLNERLRKLVRFGILEREVFAEVPPRVEYRLTPFGRRFSALLEQIAALEREFLQQSDLHARAGRPGSEAVVRRVRHARSGSRLT